MDLILGAAWHERSWESHSTSWRNLRRPLGHALLIGSMRVPGLPHEDTIYEQMSHCLALGHWGESGGSGVCGTNGATQAGLQFNCDLGKSTKQITWSCQVPTSSSSASRNRTQSCHGRAPRTIQYQRIFTVLIRTELSQDIILISFHNIEELYCVIQMLHHYKF